MMIDLTRRNPLPLTTMALSLSVFFLLAAAPALARSDDRDGTAEQLTRVRSALEPNGYKDVHDLDWEAGRFEVEARNAENDSVELELDANTLEILRETRD